MGRFLREVGKISQAKFEKAFAECSIELCGTIYNLDRNRSGSEFTPLTYVYDEMEEPLTPSHLIIGRRILSIPSRSTSNEVGRNEVTLTRRAKFLQRILDHF